MFRVVFSVELRIIFFIDMNGALMSLVMGLFFGVVAWVVHILVMMIHFPFIVLSVGMVAVASVSMIVFEIRIRVG